MTVDPADLARFNAGTARARAAYDAREHQLALDDALDRRVARRLARKNRKPVATTVTCGATTVYGVTCARQTKHATGRCHWHRRVL